MDGKGDASDSDPVNRLSAKVQAVVAYFGASDLMLMFSTMARPGALTSLMRFCTRIPRPPFQGSACGRTILRTGSIVRPHR